MKPSIVIIFALAGVSLCSPIPKSPIDTILENADLSDALEIAKEKIPDFLSSWKNRISNKLATQIVNLDSKFEEIKSELNNRNDEDATACIGDREVNDKDCEPESSEDQLDVHRPSFIKDVEPDTFYDDYSDRNINRPMYALTP